MKNSNKLDLKKAITGTLAGFMLISTPMAGLAHDNGNKADANARAEAKFEAKLQNQNSNSIFKRMSAFFGADVDTKAEFKAEAKKAKQERKEARAAAKAEAKAQARADRNNNRDGRDDENDNVSVVISNVQATRIGENRAVITWTTNVRADSSVWFGKTAGISTSGDANVSRNGKVRFHRIVLNNLDANTTYYFKVGSDNAQANASFSAEASFKTKADQNADTTAPVISNVRISGVTSNQVTLHWATNEPSDSKVFYGTINPLDINASTTSNVSSDADVKNHSVTLTNLNANTVYFFKIQSGDSANNVKLTGQGAFMTAASVQ